MYTMRDYSSLSDYAFSPDTGGWVGFNPNPPYAVWGLPVAMVSQVSQAQGSQGNCVKIQRVQPAWAVSAFVNTWPWLQRDHTTTIQTYATSDGTGPCRTVKLTHPSFAGQDGNYVWGGSGAATDQIVAAYLFATSAVLKAEFFDTSNVLYRTASYGGWSFRSYFNSDGGVYFTMPSSGAGTSMTVSLPLEPEPTQITVVEPGLPVLTKTLSSWDRWGYANTLMDGQMGSQEAGTVTNVVRRQGLALDVLPYTETRTLSGASIPNLRNGVQSGFQVGQTNHAYDALDRRLQTSVQIGKAWTLEKFSYTGTNPQPDETTQLAGSNGGGIQWVPDQGFISMPPTEYQLSGKAGTVNVYGGGPSFLLASQTDKLTRRITTYQAARTCPGVFGRGRWSPPVFMV